MKEDKVNRMIIVNNAHDVSYLIVYISVGDPHCFSRGSRIPDSGSETL